MALLAGSKLAAHTLQLTTGSRQMLPDIFPGVDHIGYFRLRTDAATDMLLNTGHHLGAVAVPYALAVHEDFAMTTLRLLVRLGFTRTAPGNDPDSRKNPIRAWNMHQAIYMTLGLSIPARGTCVPAYEHFHLLREMRNAQIHSGGDISQRLADEVRDISTPAAIDWERLARRTPGEVIATPPMQFTIHDIFTVFATTKTMGREINTLLRDHLPHDQWAQLCIEDYASFSSNARGSDQWIRGLLGHAKQSYGTVGITEQELVDKAITMGFWAAGKTYILRRSARGVTKTRDRGTKHPGAS